MKNLKCMFVLMMVTLVTSFTYGQETLKMFVKENKVPCQGVGPMECLQVKYDNKKDWQFFYDHIDGFNFEKGNRYEITVIRTKRQGLIPADASSYEYKLKSIISKTPVTAVKGIYDTKMTLTRLNGKTISTGNVYLTINPETGTISGKSGCNRFSVNYTQLASKNQIQIGSSIGTLMACDEASMKLEQNFTKAIQDKKFKIVQKNNKVQFKNLKNKIIMEFTIPTQNDIWSFIGKNDWKLIMLENVGQDYGKASIKFDTATKKVSGNSGCNNFFGTYTLKGNDHIQFGNLGSTRMACIDPEAAKTEQKILSLLDNKDIRFDVAEQTLNFYLDDKLIMMFGTIK
ncbi:META domain-containing protein [Flavobacterium sp. LS1R49]|uniref:META domain-containing protein n=1 Tax=Flavobacterium shii TaxID=2987687 RepID=A0A9X2YX71_9FLAO|nr:META domain-containing protein [Flavobacterium shii]MCV9929764.1 META domain-containing protein [Flavobacterium shii]